MMRKRLARYRIKSYFFNNLFHRLLFYFFKEAIEMGGQPSSSPLLNGDIGFGGDRTYIGTQCDLEAWNRPIWFFSKSGFLLIVQCSMFSYSIFFKSSRVTFVLKLEMNSFFFLSLQEPTHIYQKYYFILVPETYFFSTCSFNAPISLFSLGKR